MRAASPPSGFVGCTGGVCQVAPPEEDQRGIADADHAGGLGRVGAERVASSHPGSGTAQVTVG
jgi:hypothetical protein